MRLIDADALDFCFPMTDGLNGILKQIGIEMAKARAMNAPTIEAEPVRHGRWFDTGVENETGNIYFCSVCNKYNNPNKKDVEMKRAKEKPAYCPNCGAKMGGEDDA